VKSRVLRVLAVGGVLVLILLSMMVVQGCSV
jgi:hypothetical protein